MLSKEVCRRCAKGRIKGHHFEYHWDHGVVLCPGNVIAIDGGVPRQCAFYLEQIMKSTKEDTCVKLNPGKCRACVIDALQGDHSKAFIESWNNGGVVWCPHFCSAFSIYRECPKC
jgi:hypothetical protein